MNQACFSHHDYGDDSSERDFAIVSAKRAAAITAPQPSAVTEAAIRLRGTHVRKIILVHGTFTGNDVIGLARELARVSPGLAKSIQSNGKSWVDQVAGDVGNYTQAFAKQLSTLINTGQPTTIEVDRFNWSGENAHLGRAEGAVALLHTLMQQEWSPGSRVQIWGHSHGGNLIAMASQLIRANADLLRSFFSATRSHHRGLPQWEQVQSVLIESEAGSRFPKLDAVTFGTPLRYRWNTDVTETLSHFGQHRVLDDDDACTARLPASAQDVIDAVGGDYIQQLGIAGTDFLPSIFAPRTWLPERRLSKMFAAGIRRRDLRKNLKQGQRVSQDGTTLLVDYPDCQHGWNRKLFGHGVYTRQEWIPFHLNAVMHGY